MSTANKLTYLNGTKQAIKQAINEDFEVIDNNTTFREYADEISSNNAKYKDLIPKETKNATNTLDISNSAGLDKALVTQYGNTYQEGEPTPDAPVEIQVVSGDNEIKVQNKNLTLKNVKGYFGSNSILIDNGSESFVFYATQGETYTFSSQTAMNRGQYAKVETLNIVNNTPISNKTSISVASSYNSATFTCSFTGYCIVYVNSTANNAIAETFQIEVGTTSTTYVEHKGYTKEINLGNIELCKISTKDRIYPLNGKWYLEKKIGKVVLDGSESGWHTSSLSVTGYKSYYVDSSVRINQDATGSKCNYFEYKTFNEWQSLLEATFIENTYQAIGIRVTETLAPTLEDFKTWLSTHNTIAYFVLATPATEEITESNYPTLYNQLNNIKLFEGVNHITMTNESGLDVEFDITYYKDWKLD